MIQMGILPTGSPETSGNEINEQFQVSNTAPRMTLHELEKEGWIARVKEKGTSVKDQTMVRSINRILGFAKNVVELDVNQQPS